MDGLPQMAADYGAYGALVIVPFIWFIHIRLVEGKNKMEQIMQALKDHEDGCQADRIRRANWEGKVDVHIRGFFRRFAALERASGMPSVSNGSEDRL